MKKDFGMTARTKSKKGSSYFELGSWNVECDRSGFKVKASSCRYEWDNSFVRDQSWEERQPMDFIRGFEDKQAPAVSRPGTGDTFLEPGQITRDDL